jgi:integrase
VTGQRGQVWKRGKDDWCIRYRTPDGKRPQECGFKTKGDAQTVLDHKLRSLKLGAALTDPPSFDELVRDFLAQYDRSKSRAESMKWALAKAQHRFGRVRIDRLHPRDLGAFRHDLPEQQRHQVFAALRQVLEQAVRWKLIAENPAKLVRNPQPRRGEVAFLEDWATAEKLAAELGSYGPLVIFACGTGTTPQEWSALERRDLDLREGVVQIRRFLSSGVVTALGKTDKRRRRIPLRSRVVDELRRMPARVDTRLVFPGRRGGLLDLHNWRQRDWKTAVEAAGLDERLVPYSMRHTYAAWSIAAGVDVFTLSRRMGTSIEMLNTTYGHLLPSGEEHERFVLDRWDAGHGRVESDGTVGHDMDTAEGEADA